MSIAPAVRANRGFSGYVSCMSGNESHITLESPQTQAYANKKPVSVTREIIIASSTATKVYYIYQHRGLVSLLLEHDYETKIKC